MTAQEIIRSIMAKKKIPTINDLNMVVSGKKHSTTNWRFMAGRSKGSIDKFLEILDALGYEVVVRPKGKYRPKYILKKESDNE